MGSYQKNEVAPMATRYGWPTGTPGGDDPVAVRRVLLNLLLAGA